MTEPSQSGRFPVWAVACAALLAGGAVFCALTGPDASLPAAARGATELATALLVLVSAGGWGGLIVRRLAPVENHTGFTRHRSCGTAATGCEVSSTDQRHASKNRSRGRLSYTEQTHTSRAFRAVSASAVGLWMLSTGWLIAGSLLAVPGPGVCWAVVVAGFVLAWVLGWPTIRRFIPRRRVGGWSLVWIPLAVAAAVWLAGALRPPGTVGLPDAYDVLEYHLQVPREFLQAGRIVTLRHNAYSFYPLGVEMLYLLAMGLRSGAYEGVYLAKLLHGSLGVLAVAGLMTAPTAGAERTGRFRGRFAGLLLASTPGVLYVSWLAFSELGIVCYLALGLGWLGWWVRTGGAKPAAMLGLMLGAACCTKYLAVGFVLLPAGLAMLLAWAVLRRTRPVRFRQVALAWAVAGAAFAPWLVRNAAATGNPVFPLATDVLGRGHWSAEEARRWQAGHGPAMLPPVPPPPGWNRPDYPSRGKLLVDEFLLNDAMGPGTLMLAGAALLGGLIVARGRLRRFGWAGLLVGVAGVQIGLWTAVTHGMPWRFVLPAVVPLCLLAGGGLERLATWTFRGALPGGLAVLLGTLAVGGNLVSVGLMYLMSVSALNLPPLPNEFIARHAGRYGVVHALPAGSRVLLIGDVPAWYYPAGTMYATAFDRHPLLPMSEGANRGAKLLERLPELGATHVLVHWPELWRLSATYGYPADLRAGLYRNLHDRPELDWLADLQRAGAVLLHERYPDRPAAARRPARLDPYSPPPHWPTFSLFAIPPAEAGPDWLPPPVRPPDEAPGPGP